VRINRAVVRRLRASLVLIWASFGPVMNPLDEHPDDDWT
jgi:hypothetical protein